jgi:site-specific DNA-methyltransferase (adenine-specific)
MRTEHISDATLYLADCRDVLPFLKDIDALITDPPYGVELTGKTSKEGKKHPKLLYDDTEEHFINTVLPSVVSAIQLSKRALVFPGIRQMWKYPEPADTGGIVFPNATGCGRWGFNSYNPALLYGVSPYLETGQGSRSTSVVMTSVTSDVLNDHPCPKPIQFMTWAVETASLPGELVLDPFMGSGTTGVACAMLGRRFVGIEIIPEFFEIACRRIEDAQGQKRNSGADQRGLLW